MKRTTFAIPAVCMLLLLSACSGASRGQGGSDPAQMSTHVAERVSRQQTALAPTIAAVASQPPASAAALNTDYDNAVSVEMQLLVGTFQLEGTDLAVTKEQAATLLPLWKQVQALAASAMPSGQPADNATPQAPADNSATQQQVDALMAQIQAAMTPAQLQIIGTMQITQETAMAVMQAQGFSMGGPQQGGGNGGPGDGQPPQGTPPADGQLPGGGQAPRGGGRVPSPLVDALVTLLESK